MVFGLHRAGLTNLVWGDTAGRLELVPDTAGLGHFETLCQMLERPYMAVTGAIAGDPGDRPGAADFRVSPERIADALERLAAR